MPHPLARTGCASLALTATLTLVPTAATPVHAQHVGIAVGMASSTVDWAAPSGTIKSYPAGNRTAISPALVAQWRETSWIGVSTELRYAPRGYAITEPTLRVEYLQVPLLLRLGRLSDSSSRLQPFVEGGPTLMVQTSCALHVGGNSAGCSAGGTGLQNWQTSRFDVSAVLGGGLALTVGEKIIMGGIRVDRGLRSIIAAPNQTQHRASVWYLSALLPL